MRDEDPVLVRRELKEIGIAKAFQLRMFVQREDVVIQLAETPADRSTREVGVEYQAQRDSVLSRSSSDLDEWILAGELIE